MAAICPLGGIHEYRVQDGWIICARHGYWVAKVVEYG